MPSLDALHLWDKCKNTMQIRCLEEVLLALQVLSTVLVSRHSIFAHSVILQFCQFSMK